MSKLPKVIHEYPENNSAMSKPTKEVHEYR